MAIEGNQIATFGDTRRRLLDVIEKLCSGDMDVSRGMAVAANIKVLNDNIQVEINAAKMSLLTKDEVHSFGRVVGMGQRLIGNSSEQIA